MKNKLSIAFGFLLIAIAGYIIYEIFSWLGEAVKDVNPSVGAALVAGTATVISSVFIASYNSRKAKEKTAFEAHREKKAETYNEFMDVVIQLMRNTKQGKEGDDVLPENIEEFFYNFTSKIMVYGGPGVVKAYSNWRAASASDESATQSLLLVDSLFREMRLDLGESNKGIEANELLGLFIIGGKTEIAAMANKAIKADS
ncbi:hypothetical protein C7H85_02115 [Zobellella endophytica]|uniref:DUF4760 domain-containing protein n=1 Tax=Zobellella endophytica TaxID=2116700 RepID=A0A2P7RBN2_9GAMM|nr:hypothetical protein [Zobellella endophytica]PSJ47648.1 hypothetical protein C7H85_02115 [Zobellella endophytica]